MSDWFSTAVEMQREILRAQQAQIDAAQRLLDGVETSDLTAIGQQAADAQRAA